MYLKVPYRISNGILKFCHSINFSSKPVYVQIVPISGAIRNECFGNVDKKIDHSGGSKVHGWSIWEWKGIFIEAEFHAVWKSPKGSLVDVSLPSSSNEKKRLFLPDSDVTFDGHRVNNIRKELRNAPIIQQFFAAYDEKLAFVEKYSLPGQFGPISLPRLEAEAIERKIVYMQSQLLRLSPLNTNSACFCGSGMKYKHCCL